MNLNHDTLSVGASPNVRVLNARDDDDFARQMYALADTLVPGLLAIGLGPVDPALARDAQQALNEHDALLVWLAPKSEFEIRLGVPDQLDEGMLEHIYSAIESAFPELLDTRFTVSVAPLGEVLALGATPAAPGR